MIEVGWTFCFLYMMFQKFGAKTRIAIKIQAPKETKCCTRGVPTYIIYFIGIVLWSCVWLSVLLVCHSVTFWMSTGIFIWQIFGELNHL